MNASFAEVLAREATALASVTDTGDLDRWRIELVELATDPETAYARVLRPTEDARERAAFLDIWSDLITAAIARVTSTVTCASPGFDPRRVAISVLAALYGGAVLSRVARDAAPLRTSVELSLASLCLAGGAVSGAAKQTGLSVP